VAGGKADGKNLGPGTKRARRHVVNSRKDCFVLLKIREKYCWRVKNQEENSHEETIAYKDLLDGTREKKLGDSHLGYRELTWIGGKGPVHGPLGSGQR